MGEVRCGGAEKEVGKVRYGVLRWKEGEVCRGWVREEESWILNERRRMKRR